MKAITSTVEQGTCEVVERSGTRCGAPAVYRYPAMGGGYMHLCQQHGEPHAPCDYTERWTGTAWDSPRKATSCP